MTDDEFMNEINVFRDTNNIPPTTFGKMVMNDTKFLERLEAGSSVTLRTANRVLEFMNNYAND